MTSPAIRAAHNFHEAVGNLLASCGYERSNTTLLTVDKDADRIRRNISDARGLIAVVCVDVSGFEMEGGPDVRWDCQNFNLGNYGLQKMPAGAYMDLIRDGVMGFWEE